MPSKRKGVIAGKWMHGSPRAHSFLADVCRTRRLPLPTMIRLIVNPWTEAGISIRLGACTLLVLAVLLSVAGCRHNPGEIHAIARPADVPVLDHWWLSQQVNLRAGHFNAESGWAVGENGIILRFQNRGWQKEEKASNLTPSCLNAIWISQDGSRGWAVGDNGTFLRFEDGQWQKDEKASSLNSSHLRAIWMLSDGSEGWAVGDSGVFFRFEDGQWQKDEKASSLTSHYLNAIWLLQDGSKGWAVGNEGTILCTTDSGKTWTLQSGPTTARLYSVHFVNATTGWAVGEEGTILSTTDGGQIWTAQNGGTWENLRSVHFIDATTGWAVGEEGKILSTTDSGKTWIAQSGGTTSLLCSVQFVNATTGWALGEESTILSTTDSGKTWAAQSGGTTVSLDSVHFVNATTGWTVGRQGMILSTTDAGETWAAEASGTTAQLQSVYFVDETTGWAVGAEGTILSTTDGGKAWTAESSGTTASLCSVQFVNATTGWAVGAEGTILSTADGGKTWTTQISWMTATLNSVHFIDATTGWAVGDSGTILSTTDSGQTWTEQRAGTKERLSSVYFVSATTGWVTGDERTILSTTDGGQTWTAQDGVRTATLKSVHFVNPTTGWAVGEEGTIVSTADGGQTWTEQRAGTKERLSSVYFVNATTGWIVGPNGTILSTTDGGQTWSAQSGGMTARLYSVHFVHATTGWAVGEEGTILSTTDGGQIWTAQNGGTWENLRSVHFIDATTGWAVGEQGTILSTMDGGKTWTSQNGGTAAYLSSVHFVNATTGWAVGEQGTILSTTDSGETWTAQNGGTTVSLDSVHFVNTTTGWTVGRQGTILSTTDAGETWAAEGRGTTAQLQSVYFVDETTGWAVGEEGTILSTMDGGKTWTAESSGTTGCLYSVQFVNATTGWAVGAEGTILSTPDGGKTWTTQASWTTATLSSVHFIDATSGWAVGDGGTILRRFFGESAPSVAEIAVTNEATSLSWLVRDYSLGVECIAISFQDGKESTPRQIDLGDGVSFDSDTKRFSFDWDPTSENIRDDAVLYYTITMLDGFVGLSYSHFIDVGFQRTTWWERRSNGERRAIVAGGILSSVVGAYLLLCGLLYWGHPSGLVALHRRVQLDQIVTSASPDSRLASLARLLVTLTGLKLFVTNKRVRKAWIEEFRKSAAKLVDLPDAIHTDYLQHEDFISVWVEHYRAGELRLADLPEASHPRCISDAAFLDAWVELRVPRAMAGFKRLHSVSQRLTYIPLPVRRDSLDHGELWASPAPVQFRPLFKSSPAIIAIVGYGGTGKSTLAYQLARWALDDDPQQRIAAHRMIPVLIEDDTDDLLAAICHHLRELVGPEELTDGIVEELLRQQRLLIIVDALSERTPKTQRAVATIQATAPVNALVVTTRHACDFGPTPCTQLWLQPDAAVPFLDVRTIRSAIGNARYRDYARLARALLRRIHAENEQEIEHVSCEKGRLWTFDLPDLGLNRSEGQSLLLLRQKNDKSEFYDELEKTFFDIDAVLLFIVDIVRVASSPSQGTSHTVWLRYADVECLVDKSDADILPWLGRIVATRVDIEPYLPYQTSGNARLFFGRNEEFARLMAGNRPGGVLIGAHRAGKTSLLHRIKERLERRGRQVIGPLTLGGKTSLDSFFEDTLDELGLEFPDTINTDTWGRAISTYAKNGTIPVFLLDEVDDLLILDVQNDQLLGRRMRALQSDGKCEFYLAGHKALRQAIAVEGGPFRNFAEEVTVVGLSANAGMRLIREPIQNLGFSLSEDQAKRIYDGTAGIPVLIQTFCICLLGQDLDTSTSSISDSHIEHTESDPGYLETVFEHFMYAQTWHSMVVMLIVAINKRVGRRAIQKELGDLDCELSRDRLDRVLRDLRQFSVIREPKPGEFEIAAGHLDRAIESRDPVTLLESELQKGKTAGAE